MRHADLMAVRRAMVGLRDAGHVVSSVLLFSPYYDLETGGLPEHENVSVVWPDARIHGLEKGQWDLDGPMPPGTPTGDVGIICNTFMCSSDPALWLRHLADAVPVLVMQDLASCKREDGRSCSIKTGDVARYSISSHGIIGRTDPGLTVFDLAASGYELMHVEGYADIGSSKFVAVMRLR